MIARRVLVLLLLIAAIVAGFYLGNRYPILPIAKKRFQAEVERLRVPDKLVFPQTKDTARLFNGVSLLTSLVTSPGQLASIERGIPNNYLLDLKLNVAVPAAANSLPELTLTNAALPQVLPFLDTVLPTAQVSRFYHILYNYKLEHLRHALVNLEFLLSPTNFYDTNTVLELQHPTSKRRALLVQTRMEVDSDGSDADRWNFINTDPDPDFQPLTSYRWPRKNPEIQSVHIAPLQQRLNKLKSQVGSRLVKQTLLQKEIEAVQTQINQLTHYGALIGWADPFVVLPGFVRRDKSAYQAHLGDYVAVIVGSKIYPAIFGDVGPNYKMGEASLRIAKAINPNARAFKSPLSNLGVTLVVFPNTADNPIGPPDLEKIYTRVKTLLQEMGGIGVTAEVQHWDNIIPTPTPSPTPTPTPLPIPSFIPSPVLSPSPAPTA